MFSLRFIAAALLPPLLAGSALAQQPAAPPPRAPAAWQVDWGSQFCSMIHQAGDGWPYATAIVQVPGSDHTQILLFGEGTQRPPGGITSVVLAPGGRAFDVTSAPELRARRYVTALSGLPRDFRDALAGASELQLKAGAETLMRIPLAHVRAAVAAHRRCTAQALRGWGVDEAALEALGRRPKSTNNFGLTIADYPFAALRMGTQGRVIARLTIGTDGRVTECTVVASSGSPILDATTCRVALSRARFQPALDAAGRPVTVHDIVVVTWTMR